MNRYYRNPPKKVTSLRLTTMALQRLEYLCGVNKKGYSWNEKNLSSGEMVEKLIHQEYELKKPKP